MKVTVAESAGFCFGVQRAVSTVEELIQTGKHPIYTYGPIIHNDEVIKEFREKGVEIIASEKELLNLNSGTVIIRSHGAPKRIYDMMEQKGIGWVDATCPFVKKIHQFVMEYSVKGYTILIVGDRNHPEVEGIMGWNQLTETYVVNDQEQFDELPDLSNRKLCLVCQTTYNGKKFKELVEKIQKKGYDIIVLDTICNATNERQEEAGRIASVSDAMLVIGDRKSSNTQKLFEICERECKNTYYIQTIHDLDLSELRSLDNVGITAGASTPNKIIEEVQKNVRNEF